MKAFEWASPTTINEAVQLLKSAPATSDMDEAARPIAGGQDLLYHGDLHGRIGDCRHHDDQRRTKRLLMLALERLFRSGRLRATEVVCQQISESRAAGPLDDDEAPGPQAAVVRCARGAFKNELERAFIGGRFGQRSGGAPLQKSLDRLHFPVHPWHRKNGLHCPRCRRGAGKSAAGTKGAGPAPWKILSWSPRSVLACRRT